MGEKLEFKRIIGRILATVIFPWIESGQALRRNDDTKESTPVDDQSPSLSTEGLSFLLSNYRSGKSLSFKLNHFRALSPSTCRSLSSVMPAIFLTSFTESGNSESQWR